MKEIFYFLKKSKDGVDAGITTRHFPLHLKKTDELGLSENQDKFVKAFPQSESRFMYPNQTHGANVAVLDDDAKYKNPGFYRLADTDGMITNIPGLTLLVMTADCLSLFLHAPGWAGVVHAGWRGTQKEITAKALDLLMQKSGCIASEVQIILGPSICGSHYEVGGEFTGYFSAPALKAENGKLYLDLAEENKKQILAAGVPEKNISNSGFCTLSENKDFYSFRAEKESAGRMISFIQL